MHFPILNAHNWVDNVGWWTKERVKKEDWRILKIEKWIKLRIFGASSMTAEERTHKKKIAAILRFEKRKEFFCCQEDE